MIDILLKIFEANSGKSTIELKDNCSICGKEITVKITPTSGGYGLQNGILFKTSADAYSTNCVECYELNSKQQWSLSHKKP